LEEVELEQQIQMLELTEVIVFFQLLPLLEVVEDLMIQEHQKMEIVEVLVEVELLMQV
jgi:hypothetical protein